MKLHLYSCIAWRLKSGFYRSWMIQATGSLSTGSAGTAGWLPFDGNMAASPITKRQMIAACSRNGPSRAVSSCWLSSCVYVLLIEVKRQHYSSPDRLGVVNFPEEAKRWKTNFRCALYSAVDVKFMGVIKDGRVHYRKYKLLNKADPSKAEKSELVLRYQWDSSGCR